MNQDVGIHPLGVAVWGAIGLVLGGLNGLAVGAALNIGVQIVARPYLNRILSDARAGQIAPSAVNQRGYTTPGGLGY